MSDKKLRRLAEEHVPAVSAYLRRRLYPLPNQDLDDLIEQTLIAVWRRLEDCPPDAERAWMIGIARNVLSNARRSASRRARLNVSLPTPREVPAAEVLAMESVSLADAFRSLTPSEREILMLHAWDGLSDVEIGITLGITTKAAESRLGRARRHFNDRFQVPRGKTPVVDMSAHRGARGNDA